MNTRITSIALLLAAIICLAGCNSEEVRTVEWYTTPENKAALDAQLAECKNNPGQLKDTPNCQNARAAFEAIFKSGTFEKVKEPEFGF